MAKAKKENIESSTDTAKNINNTAKKATPKAEAKKAVSRKSASNKTKAKKAAPKKSTGRKSIPPKNKALPDAAAVLTEAAAAADDNNPLPAIQPALAPFFMVKVGSKFFCMQRGATHDIEHASFFKESRCRLHMKDRHGIDV